MNLVAGDFVPAVGFGMRFWWPTLVSPLLCGGVDGCPYTMVAQNAGGGQFGGAVCRVLAEAAALCIGVQSASKAHSARLHVLGTLCSSTPCTPISDADIL